MENSTRQGIRYDLAYQAMPWDSVDTVVFDIGNILISYAPENFIEKLFPGDGEKQRFMLENIYNGEYWPMLDAGLIGYEEAVEKFVERWGGEREEYRHALMGWLELKEPVEEGWRTVAACKRHEKRLILLSNFGKDGYEYLRRTFADRFDQFDAQTISCYVHQLKPNAEIYETLIATHGLTPERTLFIDDTLKNVEAARDAGIHGFHKSAAGTMDAFFCGE